jgi:hypothetical protein
MKIISPLIMNNLRPRPVFDELANDKCPESIVKHKLYEKYLFFEEKDVNEYFYKRRTLNQLEFQAYKRKLDNLAKQLNPVLIEIDERERKPLVKAFHDGFSQSYSKKSRFWEVEPQSNDPYWDPSTVDSVEDASIEDAEPQFFNPLDIFSDPIGIKKMSEHIPDILQTIEEKLPDSEQRDALFEAFMSFEKKVPSLSKGFGSDTLKQASVVFCGLTTICPEILIAIASAWHAHSRSWTSFAFFIACAIYFVIKLPDKIVYLVNLYVGLSEHVSLIPSVNMEEIQPQMSDDTLECIGSVIAIALIGVVGKASKTSAAVLTLAFVKDFSRTRMGMIDLTKLVLKFIESLVNLFREKCMSLPSIKFLDSCSKEIDEFSKECRLYVYKHNRGTLPMNDAIYVNITGLLEVGKYMLRTIPKDKHSESSLRCIHEDCNNLRKIITELERCDVTLRGLHQEPVAVLLAGGPGTAKSVSANYLAEIVAKDNLSDEELADFMINSGPYIYSRKQENVFFDSLTNKARVMLYDDFLQARDVAGNPACEAMEIIRILNSEEYSAHMAHLENKGNVFIRPKYVILTTNQPNLTSNAIISNAAMKRRIDLSYVVTPKERFLMDEDSEKDMWNRRIDKRKLPMTFIEGTFDPSLKGELVSDLQPEQLLYHEYDLMTGRYGKTLEFAEVLDKARSLERVKRKQFALHRENFKRNIKKYAKIYDSVVQEEVVPDDYVGGSDCDDTEDEDSFIDSFDATPYMKKEIESLLSVDPKYTFYVHGVVSANCIFSHSDEMVDVLLDEFGYNEVVRMIVGKQEFSMNKPRYNKRRELKTPLRKSIVDIIDKYLDKIPGWDYIKSFVINNKSAILTTLSFLAGSSLMIWLGKWIYSWFAPAEAQSFGFSDKLRGTKTPNKNSYYRNSNALKQAILVSPQFGDDTSGIDLINSIVRRNCYKVETLRQDGIWIHMGTFTFVRGRIGIMDYHFILKFADGFKKDPKRLEQPVRFSHGNDDQNPGMLCTVRELINGHKTGILSEDDLVLVEMPRRFPERRDIVDCFCLQSDLQYHQTNLDIVLTSVGENRGFYFGKGRRFHDLIHIPEKHFGFAYLLQNTFVYDIPTKAGDCGSLMCILNSSLQKRKIFGIHVAGQTHRGDGFASVVTQEGLLQDLQLFDPQIVSEEIELTEPQCGDMELPLRFEIMGRTNLVCMRNTLTDIQESRIHGLFGDNGLRPAALRPFVVDGTLIDPLLNAQRKYCQPDILLDYEVIRNCCRDYFSYCEWNERFTVDRRIFTTEEAIYGLEFDSDFASISSSTSAGWPSNVFGVRNLKKELFSYDRETYEHGSVYEEVCDRVKSIEDKAKERIRMFHVFTDNLKDELRETDKVFAGSTRLFSGCEFHYLILFRKYFGAFSLWYMKNKIRNGSSVGVNPYSSDWNSIAQRLINISSTNILAGDYSKYDGSQKPIIHLLILDAINKWYGNNPRDNRIRSILWMEVYNSRHICDGIIYEWLSGLGSGHAFTIDINTIYNHIAARYVWYQSVGDYSSFNNNVYVIALGDDITMSVTDAYKDKFNDVIFTKKVAELGLTYTNETKSGEIFTLRSLGDIEFLKRSFVFDSYSNLFIAPLKLRSILKMIDWTKRKRRIKIVCDNVVTAIKELSLHEESVFDFYSQQIIKNFKESYPGEFTSEPLELDFRRRRDQVMSSVSFY